MTEKTHATDQGSPAGTIITDLDTGQVSEKRVFADTSELGGVPDGSAVDADGVVKVHDAKFLKGKKRLYMTATPRLFSDDSKSKAAQNDAVLCSMDEPSIYGEEIFRIGFGQAVEDGLLSDYKVLILTVSENDMTPAVQQMVADSQNEINTDDTSKLIGCINALSNPIRKSRDKLNSYFPTGAITGKELFARAIHDNDFNLCVLHLGCQRLQTARDKRRANTRGNDNS